jgi:hypothetical protein
MTTVKKTEIKLPKTVGANALSESFGKINLSPEVKEFLASLNARITVTYSSGAEKPELEILDRSGTVVCSIDEFVKLGGFRRWVNDELKELEKIESSSKKIELVAYFFRLAVGKKIALPARMEEANETKFRQFHSMAGIVTSHLETVEGTVENDARAYILDRGHLLLGVIYKLMLDCLRSEKLQKEALEEALFERGIPKWLYNKLTDKQFTANLKNDSTVLLFPKGNYLKSIGLTTKEILTEEFLTSNRYVAENSGSIIKFAQTFPSWKVLPVVPKTLAKDVDTFMDTYFWTMISPYTAKEILEIRAAGKSIPTFKARQKPNPKPGSKTRPETETQRICREIHNILGVMVSTWLHMQNLVFPCANPLAFVWSKIINGTDAWEITPTHGLYEHIIGSKTDLTPVKALTSAPLLPIMAEIVCQNMQIPAQSDAGKTITKVIEDCNGHSTFVKRKDALDPDIAKYDVDLPTMERTEISGKIVGNTKEVLGIVSKTKKEKKRRGGQANVRLSTAVLNELQVLENTPIYDRVKEWISSTFKTGKYKETQLLAARMVAGEVLKYQDELLDEDFDEYRYLEDVEDEEED